MPVLFYMSIQRFSCLLNYTSGNQTSILIGPIFRSELVGRNPQQDG